MARILVYTVSRASTPEQCLRTRDSLLTGAKKSGLFESDTDWILWCNDEGILKHARAWWLGPIMGTGENVGIHVALGEVLKYARAGNYDYLVKVDDDVEWMTKGWLRKLVMIAQEIHQFSGKHPLLGPRVEGLKHPPPIAGRIKLNGKIPLLIVPILGGLCRLHHLSFFDDYTPDVRRALGAGGDTSVMQHANEIHVPLFQAHWVRVGHHTQKKEEEDPGYYSTHAMYQIVPYIPAYKEAVTNA